MPKYNNQFQEPGHYQHVIVDRHGTKIGTLRVKPGSLLWKPAGKQKFYAVPLGEFAKWIASAAAKASMVTQ